MDRDSVDWQGYLPAMTTPFTRDGELDEQRLRELVEWLVAEGMHGLVVAGTTGEWFSMSPSEKARLFRVVGEAVNASIPVIAGCNAYTAREAIAHATAAHEAGLSGILLTPPPYVRPCERELIAFYEDVNREVKLPMCVYNWPPGTNLDMRRETLERLADLEQVVAIKNSTADPAHFLDVLDTLGERVRVFGVTMDETGAQWMLEHGAAGTMGAGAVLGDTHPNFFNALWAGKRDEALAHGRRDRVIMSEWFNSDLTAKFGSAQAVFKAALNLQGLPGGYPRRPILPLEQDEIDVIRTTLDKLGRL